AKAPSGDPACCRPPPDIAPAAPTAGTPRTPTDTAAPTTPLTPSDPTPAPGATARCPYRKCWARRTPQGRRRLLSGLPGPWPQFAYSWEAIRSPQRGFVGQDGLLRAGWQPAPGGHLQTSTGGLPTRRRLPTPKLRILHKLWGGPPGRGALWARTPSSRGWNNWVSIMQSARRPTGASAADRGVRPTINADCAIPGKTSGIGLPTCPTSQHLPPLYCLTLKSLPLITHILLREPPDQAQRRACIVLPLVLRLRRIVRKVFRPRVRVAAHTVKGQGQNGLRECRVGVGILGPAIHQQEEVALPSHGQFRQPGGAETQLHFVAGTQDHHAVVCLRQQLLHRAVARVIAGGRVPHRSGAHAGVIEPLRLLAFGIDGHRRETAEMQVRRRHLHRGEPCGGRRAVFDQENFVPVE